ncbi:MAG: hypothetical protein ACXABY_32410 [Candidatus Thorarchaeota archaeon]|jgi:hypothetical protein
MLGELIIEEQGKITAQKVLDDTGPKMEASFQNSGKVLGVEATNLGTFSSVLTPAGVLYGEGRGVVMTKDKEMVTWKGAGVGRFAGQGTGVSWRGAVYFQTPSQNLSRLNSVAGAHEFEIDESGNVGVKIWEWK